jgi:energy-coupling factor transport system ATP-binding protein
LSYIEFENVYFKYEKEHVINNISLQFNQNEFTAITGPNGGGKTTLGKLMTGILKPNLGRILIEKKDTCKMTLAQISSKIGYLFQNPECQIFAPTVEEEISFVLKLKGMGEEEIKQRVESVMEIFQLFSLGQALPFNLSRGEKQRLALAGILVNQPKFLVLDEPTTGLDFERRKTLSNIVDKLLEQGIGMVVISHDETFVNEHAVRIIEIAGGEVVGDSGKKAGPQNQAFNSSMFINSGYIS